MDRLELVCCVCVLDRGRYFLCVDVHHGLGGGERRIRASAVIMMCFVAITVVLIFMFKAHV